MRRAYVEVNDVALRVDADVAHVVLVHHEQTFSVYVVQEELFGVFLEAVVIPLADLLHPFADVAFAPRVDVMVLQGLESGRKG